MPIPRYSSSSALNQGQEGSRGGSERDSSMYSSDKNSGLYRSSPDLTHSSLANRRCSSTDSTDGSHGGGHSRQSSDSTDYPTRRYSTQSSSSRKTSVSTDPLQFIKVKGATDLASTAQEQIKLSAETKKMKITESISEDDSTDWQSNLAVWKNRRKSHSEKSYQMKEELEQMEREKEEPRVTSSQSTKTFSQMQEERERRKSAGLKHFYPIEDEGEDDIFSPSPSEVKHSSPASRSSSRFQSSMTPKEDVKDTKVRSRTKEDVAKWAQDSASEEEEEGGRRKETVSNSYRTITETRTSRFSRDMENNTSSPESRASRFSRDMDNNASTTEIRASRFSRDVGNNPSTTESRTSRFSRDMENNPSTTESRASRFSRDMDNNPSTTESRASRFSRDMDNNLSTTESRGSRFSRDVENSALTSESRASRFSHDTENNAPRQRRSGLPDYRTQEKDSWQKQPSEAGRDGALKENNRSSARSSVKVSNILKNFQQKEEEEAKIKPSINSSVSAGRKSFEHIVGRSSENSASVSHSVGDSYRDWSTDKGSGKSSSRSEMTSRSSSAVYASNRNSGKDYVEKTIKISQKPNSDKGFGFTLSGGADKKQPVVVEKVGLGSAADVCELQAKDEVVTINGQSVARLTSVELTHKVEDAVRTGQIELRVKRFLGSADDLEDEEDFLSTDEDVDTPDRSISKSSSIRAENSFDSLDSRDGQQKTEDEPERPWMEEHNRPTVKVQSNRRGDPTSTSSDSGYDAQTFSPYHRGDNSSNEEELAPSQQQQSESQARPSLAARTRHLYPRDEDEDDYVNLRVTESTTTSYQHQHSDRGMGKEVAPSGDVHVESRPTITVRRQRLEVLQTRAEEDNSKPAASSETRSATTASRREERHSEQTASEDSDSGPPAALRKWQRQRPRAEFTFESDEQPPKFYDQMKMSPRHPDKPSDEAPQEDTHNRSSEDTDDTLNSAMPAVSSRRAFRGGEDRQRIHTWNQKQEEERQPDEALPPGHSDAPVHSSPYQQQRVTAERAQIQQQYQDDLQRAANSERQKQQQEKQLLEPELEKMRVLEERRAQRQARLQMYAQNLDADFAPPAASSSSSSSHPAPSPMEPAYDKGGSVPGFAAGSLSMQQHTSTFTTQVNGGQGSGGGQPEVLIIDPRNRVDSGREPVEITQQGQPVQFQVKINSRETPQGLLIQPEVIPAHHAAPAPPTDHAAFLEAERERIRQEELQKIEAERLQREEEERKLLREKEEQLRRQEEMLRQQQEELRKTQERLERERQQIQQHMPSSKTQLPDHQSFTNTTHDGLQFETVTSKVRGSSPVYTSTIVAGPRRSEGRPQASQSYPERNQDGYGVRRSEPSWNSSRPQTASSWRGSVQTVSSSHSQLPRWPPAGEEQHHSATLPAHGVGQYSREDMVAMNRKATPLQAKPPSPSPVSSSASRADAASPVRREAPSKSQIHSLNSVPRAKFRHSDQWMADEPSHGGDHSGGGEGRPLPDGGRRSEAFRSQFAGPQDHWLVQEAERRRLNESGHGQGPTRAQFSGPIKPATDNYGNRWREGGGEVRLSPNMPAQLRQTLLQKTAGARGTTPSASSQEVNPPGPSPYQGESTASMSQTLPPNFGYGSGYPPSSRSDPQHPTPSHGGGRDNNANISGKQRCSHCNQELGFGAAMVIESLGLYYHTQCFRCCVCRTPLGSGVEGADVRVRVNKLHCPNCYSNDEGTRHMAAY